MNMTALLLTALTLIIYAVFCYAQGRKEIERGGFYSLFDYFYAFVMVPTLQLFLLVILITGVIIIIVGVFKFWMFVLP